MSKTLLKRSFRLEGEQGLGQKPKPELIGPVLSNLQASLRDSVRMRFLHSSRARGRVRTGLKGAVDVRFVGHDGIGSHTTILHFEVPSLGSTAPEFFAQQTFWEDEDR